MADIIVTDVTPRIQYLAGSGLPTVFSYPFPIFADTDLNVYLTPNGNAPDDVTQILVYNVDYTVTNSVPPTVGGIITLTTGANMGDVITIVRNQPDNRLNNYIAGGLFEATDVNTDFDRTVFMSQQNKMYDQAVGVHYNLSAQPVPVVDTILPVLGAGEVWVKDSGNTAITTMPYSSGGGGGGAVNSVSGTANEIVVSPTTGTVVVRIADNAILPGAGGVTLPKGNTAARAGTAGTFRFNTQTGFSEFTNDGSTWNAVSSGAGSVSSVTATAPLVSSGGSNPDISIGSAIPITDGGTGLNHCSQGDLLYGTAPDTATFLPKDTNASRYLSNNSVNNNPAWSQVDLSNGVQGNLAVTHLNSGTGATSGTFWRGDGVWAVPPGSGGGGGGNGASAWANFVTGSTTINDSFNVSSITNVGTGDSIINFTANLATALYAITASCIRTTNNTSRSGCIVKNGTTPSASAVNMITFDDSGNNSNTTAYIACFDGASGGGGGGGGSSGAGADVWVSYNTIGGVVHNQGSFNVSSLVYNSTGNVTINYTTSFGSTNYATMVSGTRDNLTNPQVVLVGMDTVNSKRLTSSVTIQSEDSNFNTPNEYYSVNVACFGGAGSSGGGGGPGVSLLYDGVAQTVLKSFNVSSVTHVLTGNYTIAFTNSFLDSHYTACGFGDQDSATRECYICAETAAAYLPGSINISSRFYSVTLADCDRISFMAFANDGSGGGSGGGSGTAPSAALNYASLTTTINSSINVSSVTYNAVGDYTVNFIVNFGDINYTLAGAGQYNTGSSGSVAICSISNTASPLAVGSTRLNVRYETGNLVDPELLVVDWFASTGSGGGSGQASKVWCNLSGSGAATVNASSNVSSATYNGTGDYTINFTVAFSSAVYSTVVSGARGTTTDATGQINYTTTSLAAGAVRVLSGDGASNPLDWALVDILCHGTQ